MKSHTFSKQIWFNHKCTFTSHIDRYLREKVYHLFHLFVTSGVDRDQGGRGGFLLGNFCTLGTPSSCCCLFYKILCLSSVPIFHSSCCLGIPLPLHPSPLPPSLGFSPLIFFPLICPTLRYLFSFVGLVAYQEKFIQTIGNVHSLICALLISQFNNNHNYWDFISARLLESNATWLKDDQVRCQQKRPCQENIYP